MRYLFLMTLAGSFLFAGYLGWERLCGKRLTQCMRYRALVMVLLAYVMPWVWMKGIYQTILVGAQSQETIIIGEMPVSYADISTKEEAFRTQNYWLLLIIVGIWVAVTAVLLFRKCRRYFLEKNGFLLDAEDCRSSNLEEIVRRLQKELHCIRRPRIYETAETRFTFTVGVIKPIIFLRKDYTDIELETILRHEMVHIVRGDLLVKLLIELACCLHWFNPLIYKLKTRLEKACETSCDEKVVKGCTKEERAVYAKIIIRDMRREDDEDVMLGSALEDDFETALERVNLIMETTKIKRFGKMVAAFAFALILFADSLTALAYPNVFLVDSEVNVKNVYYSGEYSVYQSTGSGVSTDIILYDEQIIDKDGNILPADSAVTYGLICTIFGHKDEPCYFQSHIRDGNGGCEVMVYNARICPICNHIWVESLYATHIYTVCPH